MVWHSEWGSVHLDLHQCIPVIITSTSHSKYMVSFNPTIFASSTGTAEIHGEWNHGPVLNGISRENGYSYGHLLVITGYKWGYTFYKWGFLSTYNWYNLGHHCTVTVTIDQLGRTSWEGKGQNIDHLEPQSAHGKAKTKRGCSTNGTFTYSYGPKYQL